jgi:hypothetical protein
MATVHPRPDRRSSSFAADGGASGDPTGQADAGGEIAALDKQPAVVVSSGGGEERKSSSSAGAAAGGGGGGGGGGKLVAEAMRKYAGTTSRFHGVTRYERAGGGSSGRIEIDPPSLPNSLLWFDLAVLYFSASG